jgi:hypothetical protein
MCKRLRKDDYDQEIPWFVNSYYKEVFKAGYDVVCQCNHSKRGVGAALEGSRNID